MEVSSVAKTCKIFVNEALCKERYKLFSNLRSAAQGLVVKYVWHRGGKFFARMRGGHRGHVFESQSDLQALQSASRNRIEQSFTRDARRASDVGEPRPTMLGRGSSASEEQ